MFAEMNFGLDPSARSRSPSVVSVSIGTILLCALALASPVPANATLPAQVTLPELVEASDHILIVRVVEVDMIDELGISIDDPSEKTWPFSGRTIRLHVRVDDVLWSTAGDVPETLVVPLDGKFHYRLGQVQKAHSDPEKQCIFLLKGPEYQAPFFGVFMSAIENRDEIMRLKHEQVGQSAQ